MQTEIDEKLLEEMRRVAEEQNRSEREVFEDALRFSLTSRALFERTTSRRGGLKELFEEAARWQRERGIEPLSDDEAMRLADEELHAMRRERGEAR